MNARMPLAELGLPSLGSHSSLDIALHGPLMPSHWPPFHGLKLTTQEPNLSRE